MEEQTINNPIQHPNIPTSQAPKRHSFLTNKLFLIILAIVVLFTFVYAGIYLYLGSQLNQISKPSPTPLPGETSVKDGDQTANWNIFRSQRLGLEFKYPYSIRSYPLKIIEDDHTIILEHKTYFDVWITADKSMFSDYKSLKSCSAYTPEEISKNPITCLSSGKNYGQKELVKEVELDGVKAVSFFLNTFSIGGLKWVMQTINEPFIEITSVALGKETFDQILPTFKFLEKDQIVNSSSGKIYTNREFGFSIEYPNGWILRRVEDGYFTIYKEKLGKDERCGFHTSCLAITPSIGGRGDYMFEIKRNTNKYVGDSFKGSRTDYFAYDGSFYPPSQKTTTLVVDECDSLLRRDVVRWEFRRITPPKL